MLNIKPVRLELIDRANPYHARPFPVPQSLEVTTKTEMKRLTDIDVFNRSSDSEWAAPTFIQAKKMVLNYSHSRKPSCARGCTGKSKRPESHPTSECVHACVRYLKTEPKYYLCPISLVMT
jgi:hypothetical protein